MLLCFYTDNRTKLVSRCTPWLFALCHTQGRHLFPAGLDQIGVQKGLWGIAAVAAEKKREEEKRGWDATQCTAPRPELKVQTHPCCHANPGSSVRGLQRRLR